MVDKICPQRIIKEAIELLNDYTPGDDDDLVERIENNLNELEDLVKRLDAAGIRNL